MASTTKKRDPNHRASTDAKNDEVEATKGTKFLKAADGQAIPTDNECSTGPSINDDDKTESKWEKSPFKKGRGVIALGYLGEGYAGLQQNPGQKTIEDELMKAFVSCGVVDPWNANSYLKTGWDRCARTDKGVSAALNYISLNLRWIPSLEDSVNAQLPPQIRIWDVQRVGKSFCPHKRVDCRRYAYILPTFLFKSSKIQSNAPFVFDTSMQQTVNSTLQHFVGSHRFHNYTQQLSPDIKQSIRYIKSFTCGSPFMQNGIEWVKLSVTGQSFLLNQIRKMVATAICIIRDGKPSDYIDCTFERITGIGLQMAPAAGLFLEACFFDGYNLSVVPPNEPILLSTVEAHAEKFSMDVIVPSIFNAEQTNQVFSEWEEILLRHPVDWETIVKNAATSKAEEAAEKEAKRKVPLQSPVKSKGHTTSSTAVKPSEIENADCSD